ncbi:hypothetical protein ACIRPX_02160 [Streptomyces sp. NPDC101225]|uniref:hypothetical protein n=1 Tax=Streptomyces sp. NPDC101225 TaxID=3366135 RepID=UPI00382511D6
MSGPHAYGHVPPDVLAAIALDGFRLPRSREIVAAEEHMVACVQCSTALADLLRAVAAGRGTRPDDTVAGPPARVWRAVAERTREQTALAPRAGAAQRPAVPLAAGLLTAVAGALVLARLWRRYGCGRASAPAVLPEEEVRRSVG